MQLNTITQSNSNVLSVVIHIYNNQEVLKLQTGYWMKWASIQNLELILIDDGSNPKLDFSAVPVWIKKIRITSDIAWNQPGAKNLGARLALGSWLLFLDADQFFTANNILELNSKLAQFELNTIYRFKRRCSKTEQPLDIHQNCQLISKQDYENFGGYDEDFAGHYGHEDAYFERLWRFKGGKIVVLDKPYLSDLSALSTTGLNRDDRCNELLRRRKIRYWHVMSNSIGRFIIANTFMVNFLIKIKLIANGQPTKQIRFQWEEC
jgi:glycosyltransferase involved in cell wall biosynthesis